MTIRKLLNLPEWDSRTNTVGAASTKFSYQIFFNDNLATKSVSTCKNPKDQAMYSKKQYDLVESIWSQSERSEEYPTKI